ncbi:hypothetical protein DL764_007765 [Monosporascus ibericus]|uniref:Uncharacterized protein n=1 Tax=Monosporascus ibericus TaxID=155417 RepID=A0A4Q4SZ81_9PEZI|nr:hypothetical protein DL764_007765 [Monosporascus ibericus]
MPLTIPDGRAFYPGEDLPPMRLPEHLQACVAYVTIGAKNTKPIKRSLKKKKKADLAENLPALEVDHTEYLIQLNPNGGLTYIFEMIKRDPDILPS